jgi:hypothetical protein
MSSAAPEKADFRADFRIDYRPGPPARSFCEATPCARPISVEVTSLGDRN